MLPQIQGGSISKLQIRTLMIPSTLSGSDATNWQHMLSALEGLVAQVVDVVSKNNPPPSDPTQMELAKNARDNLNVPCTTTKI